MVPLTQSQKDNILQASMFMGGFIYESSKIDNRTADEILEYKEIGCIIIITE